MSSTPKWLGPLVMLWGLLMALFATPSAGVSVLVVCLASLPFILAGVAATMQSFGRPTCKAVQWFLGVIALLVLVTRLGFGPSVQTCEASIYLSEAYDPNCTAVAAVAAATMWLAFGVAFCTYVARSREAA